MKKVLIIAPEYMGYMEKVADELRKHKNIDLTDIHIPTYKYTNLSTKIKNFFLKKLGKDVKFEYREKYIKKHIQDQTFDFIFIIRPDLFSLKTLKELKNKTNHLKSYFFDGIYRYPRKVKLIHLFDEIFSFEPNDCKEFGFQFITNFIYEEEAKSIASSNIKYSVFNITSYDRKRFPILLKIAELLKQQNQDSKIIVKSKKSLKSFGLIHIIKNPIPLNDVKLFLKESICMLDLGVIHKHKGLTFRVFEAMEFHKKIITNNPDIATYDFYNPQNILIIDENNISIPKGFLTSEYHEIPNNIYKKYTLQAWVKTIFREVL